MTMVPEAWQNDKNMSAEKKAFYRWSAFAMEPWDGPGKITHLRYPICLSIEPHLGWTR